MVQYLQLRSGNSGPAFVGENEGDTLLWSVAQQRWYVGPGGGGGGAVDSVFGRTGVVVAATGDYDTDQIDNVSNVPGSSVSDALENLLQVDGSTPLTADWDVGGFRLSGAVSYGYDEVLSNGDSGAAKAIDLGDGDLQSVTLNANTTLTLAAPGVPSTGMLVLIQDNTGSRTAAFAGVSYTSGVPFASPTPTSRTFIPWFYDGTTIWLSAVPGPPAGVALGNANVTITIAQGSQRVLPPGTLSGSPATVEMGTAGSPRVDEVVELQIYAQSQDFIWTNGGANPDTIYEVPAGEQWTLHAKWNGDDWTPSGRMRLA